MTGSRLGHRLRPAGRHVSHAAAVGGLDIQLIYFRGLNECRAQAGRRQRPARHADGGDRLPRGRPRLQGAQARPPGKRKQRRRRWSLSATPWRKNRCAVRGGGRAWPDRRAGVHVQEGNDPVARTPIARLPGCRTAPITASTPVRRMSSVTAARGRRLCRRRHQGARRPVGAARRWRAQLLAQLRS